MRLRLEYLLLLCFLVGLFVAYVSPIDVRVFSTVVNLFVDGFIFLSPLIVFVIIFGATCSLIAESDLAGPVVKNATFLFALLVMGCSLFASVVLSVLLPSAATSSEFSASTFSYVAQVVFVAAFRPVTLALMLGLGLAFGLSRSSSFGRVVRVSRVVYRMQERAFGILLKVFPLITFSLGATLYYNLGNVSLEAYATAMGLVLLLCLAALGALLGITKLLTGVDFRGLWRYSVSMFTTGLSTGSSYLALPMGLKIFREHFSVRGDVADLVITLGSSLNRCGSVMGVLAVSFVAARYTGTGFYSQQMLLLAVPLGLIALGSPGIQGGTLLVSMALILDVITPSNPASFTGTAFAIFVGGTTFIQAALNTVATGYVALLIGSRKR
jgi:proton glutamate symport protein